MIKKIRELSENKPLLEYTAGLIAAIVILVIFVLAASYFKPVVFGLLLAFLFLPLQVWYQKHVFANKIYFYIANSLRYIFSPVTTPVNKLRKKIITLARYNKKPGNISKEEKFQQKIIARSCRLTILTLFIIFLFAAGGVMWISTSYLTSATNSITTWAQKTTRDYNASRTLTQINTDNTKLKTDSEDTVNQFLNALSYKIESIKPKLEKSKIFRIIRNSIAQYLHNPANIKELARKLLVGSSGIFSYTAGAVSTVFILFLNIVFTFFFFAFFLGKLARLNNKLTEKTPASKYIANSIMSSAWFPKTSKGTVNITTKILDNILHRLRIWLRGYCTIIIIESCFYTTVFSIIGVPFGIILGLIAGITILLPYIGPTVSAILTVTISLTVGDLSMVQILFIILSYILMTGIIDQLFIYPAIVGGSLGLNEMETIIVVLLGGLLAGISGMIFAVPVASILKYLIPEVYKILSYEKEVVTKSLSAEKTE